MTSDKYEKLEFNKIADRCMQNSEEPGDYWFKCSKFIRDCALKPWGWLSYKQVNWLQNILEELEG